MTHNCLVLVSQLEEDVGEGHIRSLDDIVLVSFNDGAAFRLDRLLCSSTIVVVVRGVGD